MSKTVALNREKPQPTERDYQEYLQLLSIFNNIDEAIYIADPQTYEILYANHAIERDFGYVTGKKCHEVFQDLKEPCPFCTNNIILGEHRGKSYIWEFQNRKTRRWYRCIDKAIAWPNERTVRCEMAIDITDRKIAEEKSRLYIDKLLAERDRSHHQAMSETVNVLFLALEKRDPYTAGHERRVAQLGQAIAAKLGMTSDEQEGIRITGDLHDIGKIVVPSEILSKPAKLNVTEYAIMQTHPQVGYEILKGLAFPWPVAQTVLQHHERLDGSGYPAGLAGNAISSEARIIAVADVVEAMSSHRPYRPALGVDEALKEITLGSGVKYDQAATQACVKLFVEDNFQFM